MGAFVPDLPDGTRIHNLDLPGVNHIWSNGTFAPQPDTAAINSIIKTAKNLAGSATQTADEPTNEPKGNTTIPSTHTAMPVTNDSAAGSFSPVLILGGLALATLTILGLLWHVKRREG